MTMDSATTSSVTFTLFQKKPINIGFDSSAR